MHRELVHDTREDQKRRRERNQKRVEFDPYHHNRMEDLLWRVARCLDASELPPGRVLAKHENTVLRYDGVVTVDGEFKKRLWKRSDYYKGSGEYPTFNLWGDFLITNDWVVYHHPYEFTVVLESLHDDFKLVDNSYSFAWMRPNHFILANVLQIRVTDLTTRRTIYIEAPEYKNVQMLGDYILILDDYVFVLDLNLQVQHWQKRDTKHDPDDVVECLHVTGRFDEDRNLRHTEQFTEEQMKRVDMTF